jgi:HSP20 family protein
MNMAIVKYNPMRELRSMQEQMSRLLDMAWNREPGEDMKEGVWQPPVDIFEDKDSVVIKAELPGIDQKDIDIKIEESTLNIRGERKYEEDIRKENYHRVERFYGGFQRTFSLPNTIDQERVKASCDKGVLTVVLPKREETKPKQIKVDVA